MNHLIRKTISIVTAAAVVLTTGPIVSFSQAKNFPLPVVLPSPEVLIDKSVGYEPVMIRGMKINEDDRLSFSFILDTGHTKLKDDELKDESERIVKYFLTSLTTSEDDLWVNLSPFEKDRITSDALYQTEMGRDLLGQDYILKKMTSSLLFPDNDAGRKFWDKVHVAIYEKYAETDIPVDMFHKIWIVPESVELFVEGDKVLITSSKLKVMLEEDYFATKQSQRLKGQTSPESDAKSLFRDEAMKKVLKDVVVPIIEEEVNSGKYFANLRQIFQAMILAKWFKQHFRQELLDKIETVKSQPQDDAKKQAQQQGQQNQQQQQQGQQSSAQQKEPDVEQIYQKYLEAFKAGSEGYIRQAYDPVQRDLVVRKYVTGGFSFKNGKNDAMLSLSPNFDFARQVFAGDPYLFDYVLTRIVAPVQRAVQGAIGQIDRNVVILQAGFQALLKAVKALPVGGIDLKSDEMKVTIKGDGVKTSWLKDRIMADPTKIGHLVPTYISHKPLANVSLFFGSGTAKSN